MILATGSIFTKLAGLLSAVILARYLTKADYSTYRQALLAYGTAAPFLALGLPKALYYFLPGEERRPGGVFLENFLLLSTMGLIFMVGLWMGGADLLAWRFNNPDLASALLAFAPFAFFMLPQGGFTACMMARDRVHYVATFQPISKLVMVAAVVGVALMNGGARGAILGAVGGAALIYLPTVYLMFTSCRGGHWTISRAGIRSQISYSIPIGVAAMVGTMAGNLDKILVSSMGTREEFAVYVNGAMHLPLVGVITGSVVSVLLPDMAKHYKLGEYREAIAIWQRAAIKCGVVLIPTGMFLAGISGDIMVVLFSDTYAESAIPFALYALILPLRSISFGTPLIAAGRTKLALVESCVALGINFGLTIVAIRLFGYFGAAAATLVSTYCWAASFNALMISKTYKVPLIELLPFRQFLKIASVSLIASSSFLILLAPLSSPLIRLLLVGLIYATLLIALYVKTGIISSSVMQGIWRAVLRGRRRP